MARFLRSDFFLQTERLHLVLNSFAKASIVTGKGRNEGVPVHKLEPGCLFTADLPGFDLRKITSRFWNPSCLCRTKVLPQYVEVGQIRLDSPIRRDFHELSRQLSPRSPAQKTEFIFTRLFSLPDFNSASASGDIAAPRPDTRTRSLHIPPDLKSCAPASEDDGNRAPTG